MRLITEKRDVQDGVIEYLQSICWEYILPTDLQEKRCFDIKEPFIVEILEKKLKVNPGIITDENVGDVIRRLRLLQLLQEIKNFWSI